MGKIKKQRKVKLIFGLICAKEDLFLTTKKILSKKFGYIDFESEILPFDHTNYYQKEFGCGLKRKFISFERLIKQETLPLIKIFSNNIEEKLSKNNCRQINIDPGYLNDAKLILASTKDFIHRIYLNKGIFGEITLYYQNKTFNYWLWTFLDYKTKSHIDIFNYIRTIYLKQIKYEQRS